MSENQPINHEFKKYLSNPILRDIDRIVRLTETTDVILELHSI